MTLSDSQFREAFKPIHVPASFDLQDSKENKVVFVLAQLGSASSAQVAQKLSELEPDLVNEDSMITPDHILKGLYDRGLIRGHEENGEMIYDLVKITQANEGEVDPDALAPGLD